MIQMGPETTNGAMERHTRSRFVDATPGFGVYVMRPQNSRRSPEAEYTKCGQILNEVMRMPWAMAKTAWEPSWMKVCVKYAGSICIKMATQSNMARPFSYACRARGQLSVLEATASKKGPYYVAGSGLERACLLAIQDRAVLAPPTKIEKGVDTFSIRSYAGLTMTKKLTKQGNNLPMLTLGENLNVKQMFIADVGDGAFTDDSVKVKPNRNGSGLVLKCVCLKRLHKALKQAGFDPHTVKIIKGSKHFIAFLGEVAMGAKQVGAGKTKLLKG